MQFGSGVPGVGKKQIRQYKAEYGGKWDFGSGQQLPQSVKEGRPVFPARRSLGCCIHNFTGSLRK